MLAQRAVADSPRWTRAVEDQSAPISEEITSELGRILYIVRHAQSRIDQATLEKETKNWEDWAQWDHPTSYKVTARCGLARGTARLGAQGLGG